MNVKAPRLVTPYDIAMKKLQQGKGAPVKLRFIKASYTLQGRYQRYTLIEQWLNRKTTPSKDKAILQDFLDGKLGDDADAALEVEGRMINRKIAEFKAKVSCGRVKGIKLVESDGEIAVALIEEKAAKALEPPASEIPQKATGETDVDPKVAFVVEKWPKEPTDSDREELARNLHELKREHGRRFNFLCKDHGGPLPCSYKSANQLIRWHLANCAVREVAELPKWNHGSILATFTFTDVKAGSAMLVHIEKNRDIVPFLESGKLHPEINRQDAQNLFSKSLSVPKKFVDELKKCLERQPKEHWHQCIADGIGFLQEMQAEASA